MHLELFVDLFDVIVDSEVADAKFICDHFVAETFGQFFEYFEILPIYWTKGISC
jgi:hypothetical protein